MSSAAANQLRETLGARTGIAVRTARKYVVGSGIEIVPAGLLAPEADVFYRGERAGRVAQWSTGAWRSAEGDHQTLAAAICTAVLRHLEAAER